MQTPGFVLKTMGICIVMASATAQGTPAATVGTVDALVGHASVRRAGNEQPVELSQALLAGDEISTGEESKIRIALSDKSVIALGAESTMTLQGLRLTHGRKGTFRLLTGKFWMHVVKWTTGKTAIEVSTPNAVAGVRGTTLWGDTQVDAICALEGTVEVRSLHAKKRKAKARLRAGNCASEMSQGNLTPLKPTKEQINAYLDDVLIR